MIKELKKQIVLTAHAAGSGHIPSAFSILDIIWTLYDKVLTTDDRFVLSKGHGCLALYAVLAEKGYFPKEELTKFAKYDGILGGHPDRNKVPGVLASTGSLGHGLPMAVGMALAKKIKKESGRVFCLVGDGEMNEGSCWEACLLAVHHKLNNLKIIIDYNHSTDRALILDNIRGKFKALGFTCYEVVHPDNEGLKRSLQVDSVRPIVIIAHTIKGSGCFRMQDPSWHHRAPNDTELSEILQELKCENS